jgi:hypothetical protein
MSTKSLISELIPYCNGLDRSTGNNNILKLIERAQDRLFDYDSPMTWWIGSENEGWPPYLITDATNTKYSISAVNLSNITALTINIGGTDYAVRAKRVLKVFVDAGTIDYGKRFIGKTYSSAFSNPYAMDTDRMSIADILVDSGIALENTAAWIRFRELVNVTTDTYMVLFTYEPPRLISEDIPLAVPLDFEEAIIDYVIGTIQQRANGKDNEWLQRFKFEWIPKWQQDSSSGAQSTPTETEPRDC